MTSIPKGSIGLIGAVEEEVKTIRKQMKATCTIEIDRIKFECGQFAGKPVVLLSCGVGVAAAEAATTSLLGNFKPSSVITLGCAGALGPDVNLHDLVIGERVVHENNDKTAYTSDPVWVERASAICTKNGATSHTGPMLTVDRVVNDSSVKEEYHKRFGAIAVEMESAAIARVCSESNVPFLAFRVISDQADESLDIPFDKIPTGDQAHSPKAWAYVLIRPGLAVKLFKLRRGFIESTNVLPPLIEQLLEAS